LLDEPTTGLHRHDVARLLSVMQQIVDRGHSMIVIEHNLDVLKSADWIIELGPEAGLHGGRVVAEGTPEVVAGHSTATSPFLRGALRLDRPSLAEDRRHAVSTEHAQPSGVLRIEGAREHNLRNLSLAIPQRQLVVVTGVSGSGKSTLLRCINHLEVPDAGRIVVDSSTWPTAPVTNAGGAGSGSGLMVNVSGAERTRTSRREKNEPAGTTSISMGGSVFVPGARANRASRVTG
jgi:energy-coupling factor transporter ATP-binding protein EcfA2